jgi:hypothetical protein
MDSELIFMHWLLQSGWRNCSVSYPLTWRMVWVKDHTSGEKTRGPGLKEATWFDWLKLKLKRSRMSVQFFSDIITYPPSVTFNQVQIAGQAPFHPLLILFYSGEIMRSERKIWYSSINSSVPSWRFGHCMMASHSHSQKASHLLWLLHDPRHSSLCHHWENTFCVYGHGWCGGGGGP